MESALVNKALLDTSVIFDLERAVSNPKRPWAEATLRNAFEYRNQYRQLTISSSTYFEILAGHVQVGDMAGFEAAITKGSNTWEIIYPTAENTELAARIYGILEQSGQRIGVIDTMIAATAISNQLVLVTSNSGHFQRVQAAGFELKMQNWRQS